MPAHSDTKPQSIVGPVYDDARQRRSDTKPQSIVGPVYDDARQRRSDTKPQSIVGPVYDDARQRRSDTKPQSIVGPVYDDARQRRSDTKPQSSIGPMNDDAGGTARRRLDPDERRAQILACAIDMFGERPYAAVSTAELAQRAGVARGLINHYFGNKRDLYLVVVRRMVTLPRPSNMIAPTGTDRERVDASVSWLLDVIGEHGSTWVKVIGHEGIGDDPEVQRILDEADDAAAVRLLEMVGLSDSRHSAELRALVRVYGGMVKTAGREWITRGTLSREQVHSLLADMLLALITTSFPKIDR